MKMTTKKTAGSTTTQVPAKQMDWSFADEMTLVRGVVDRDPQAVRELMTRFKATIEKKIRYTVGRYSPGYRSSDTVDEIRAEFFEQLFVNNMSRFRAFDATKGTLTGWLSLIAQQTAQRHLNRIVDGPKHDPIETFLATEDEGSADGARWAGGGEDQFLQLLDFKRFAETQPKGINPDKLVKRFIAKSGR
jgi:DNA-directed RNA polymerase specialized sigma24 family protein